MTQDTDEVVVTLASAYTVTEHLGDYSYTVRATASGGAVNNANTRFLTYHWCYAEVADAYNVGGDLFDDHDVTVTYGPYDLPEVGHQHEYFPTAYTEWIKPPKIGCAYEFEIETPEDNLAIDAVTGVIELKNVHSEE
jgi:hypothetical protein